MDVRPTYAGKFSCIGPLCEDQCCSLEIVLSEEEHQRYGTSKSHRVRMLASQFVSIASLPTSSDAYARLTRKPSGFCGFLSAERTCTIQDECGEADLPRPCFIYPRVLSRTDKTLEGSLHLSCPEAARQVLLDDNLLQSRAPVELEKYDLQDTVELTDRWPGSPGLPYHAFKAVRQAVVEHLRNRSVSMWQRLFAIGILCEELDRVPSHRAGTLQFFQEVKRRSEEQVETLQHDNGNGMGCVLRLKIFFNLTASSVQDAACPPRLKETFWTFVEGISTTVHQDASSDVERFRLNAERYFRPLMNRNPFMLENFLLNYVFQNLFHMAAPTRFGSRSRDSSMSSQQWFCSSLG